MSRQQNQQKLVSFRDCENDLMKISDELKSGWSLINLVKNGDYYVGIMEFDSQRAKNNDTLFIPPRKKIRISK